MKYKAIPMLLALATTVAAVEIDIPAYEAELDKIAEQRKAANSKLIVERGICVDTEKKEIILDEDLLLKGLRVIYEKNA